MIHSQSFIMLIQTQPTQSYSRVSQNPGTYKQQGMDINTYSNMVNGSLLSLPKSWNQENTDDMLVTVYSFVKTFVGASGSGQGTIDNRIEQAMDLVKSHLMSAVRSEVEELRDKISKLEESVSHLSRENEVLRANVNPEILANLSNRQQCIPPDTEPGQY